MAPQPDHDEVVHAYDVFISYAHEDAGHDVANARLIGNWLEEEGYDVWWDRDLLSGKVQKNLERKVRHAKRVIVLWSPQAAASQWVGEECQWAVESGNLFPVIIEDKDLQPGWEQFLWLRFTDFDAQKDELRRRLPPPSLKRGVAIAGLPAPARTFIGREDEVARLRQAWDSTAAGADPVQKTNVFVLHAIGGAGKSALLQEFLRPLDSGQLSGAHTVYAWSAYSQGSGDNRTANADEFIFKALGFFGHDLEREPIQDGVERGRKLAKLVGERRTLMILDGLEPLQDVPHINDGRLKDRGLAEFIKTLARENKGLLLITSRQELPELARADAPRVISDPLDRMGTDEGVKLLAALGVEGKCAELERAVEEVLGHALSLNLLGSYLSSVHGGDVNQREQFRLGEIEDVEADFDGDATARYAKRAAHIMEGTLDRLGAEETAILSMLGLFDRPAEAGALAALMAEPAIPGLTEAFHAQAAPRRKARWNVGVERLRKLKLLFNEDRHAPGNLDAHPVVRAHFGYRFRAQAPEAYREAHSRLYDYYRYQGLPQAFRLPEAFGLLAFCASFPQVKDHLAKVILRSEWPDEWLAELPPSLCDANWINMSDAYRLINNAEFDKDLDAFLPDTLDGLQNDFHAIVHGCAACRHQDAYSEIYQPKFRRGAKQFITHELCANGFDLATIASFFDKMWSVPSSNLRKNTMGNILSFAGHALMAVGRVSEAIEPLEASMAIAASCHHWRNAAIGSRNISNMHLSLGRIMEAAAAARNGMAYVNHSSDNFERIVQRVQLATVLHQAGEAREALALFSEAESLHIKYDTEDPTLYSLQGYQYCDLLLALGQRQSVIERATNAAKIAQRNNWLLDVGLDALSLGRAYVALHHDGRISEYGWINNGDHERLAKLHLDRAVTSLHRSGDDEHIVSSLIARATFRRTSGAYPAAATDLAEAFDIATRGEMRLHLTDIHLETARLLLAQLAAGDGDTTLRTGAETHHAEAAALIKATGYKRRLPELAAIRACLDGAIPASLLASDRDKDGRPIWYDLAIPD